MQKRNYKELTLETAKKLHEELWTWLAENPVAYKTDWPKYEAVEDEYDVCWNDCFMCEYTARKREKDEANYEPKCEWCPIDWTDRGEYEHTSCPDGGLYSQWIEALDDTHDTYKTARIARIIANLPLKEEYENG